MYIQFGRIIQDLWKVVGIIALTYKSNNPKHAMLIFADVGWSLRRSFMTSPATLIIPFPSTFNLSWLQKANLTHLDAPSLI